MIALRNSKHARTNSPFASTPSKSKAKKEDRKRDTRRKIIVGGAVLAYMEKDHAFAKWLSDLLARSVGRINDRDTISDLLTPALAPARASIPNNKGKIHGTRRENRQIRRQIRSQNTAPDTKTDRAKTRDKTMDWIISKQPKKRMKNQIWSASRTLFFEMRGTDCPSPSPWIFFAR